MYIDLCILQGVSGDFPRRILRLQFVKSSLMNYIYNINCGDSRLKGICNIMWQKIFSVSILALLLTLSGCSESKVSDPPTSRAELTVRLFDALKGRRYTDALAILDKLQTLEPEDADLMEMRDRLIVNICTGKVQEYINNGKLENAQTYLRWQRKKHPMLHNLRMLEEDVNNLIDLRNAANRLANAATIPEIASALENIAPLAARYPDAKKLHSDIKIRRSELNKLRAAEQRKAEAAAQSPAEKK